MSREFIILIALSAVVVIAGDYVLKKITKKGHEASIKREQQNRDMTPGKQENLADRFKQNR